MQNNKSANVCNTSKRLTQAQKIIKHDKKIKKVDMAQKFCYQKNNNKKNPILIILLNSLEHKCLKSN